ncbi:peroxidase-like isoform X1 [Anopheles funestus]|uniref:peroxidase-like isoform X1 n=1 Tax=Anopheles funestus TaxID=62324 RepID=UPI0020C651B6|nr:peroxidase-like isoform X1 [Anopheles funestus]
MGPRNKLCVVHILQLFLTFQQATSQQCPSSPYRTFDGTCNHVVNPSWGAANTPFARIVNPKYADGKSSPPVATDGSDLPNARVLSVEVFQEGIQNSPEFSLANMQFGQIVAHDMALTRGVRDPLPCCANGRLQPNRAPRCFPIPVSPDDPVFSERGIECLGLIRTLTTCDESPSNCTRAEQINAVSHYLDLSVVYGNSVQESLQLRDPNTGFLKVEPRNGQDWPPRHPNASTTCTLKTPNDACYLTGDGRANQSPHLAILQITFVREHNRIARGLQALNPTWNAEKLFQEARRINIAQYQYIVFEEWLPIFLGRSFMIERQLLYQAAGPTNDYGEFIHPAVINSHTTAAFRFFHSSIQGRLKLFEESRQSLYSVNINDHTNNPSILEEASDRYPELLRGLTSQPMGLNDVSLDPATKHFLFRFNNMFGTDLKSLDIQRGRDHGLAGYNEFVYLCLNQRATTWADYNQLLVPGAIELLATYYKSVNDLDLSVGLAFEKKIDGTETGLVLRCILKEQFHRTRKGDRFFYENGNHLTTAQLAEIRKASMAKILCENSLLNRVPEMKQIQPFPFKLPSNTNPLRLCTTYPLPNYRVFV